MMSTLDELSARIDKVIGEVEGDESDPFPGNIVSLLKTPSDDSKKSLECKYTADKESQEIRAHRKRNGTTVRLCARCTCAAPSAPRN
jgi:hypothetical protein